MSRRVDHGSPVVRTIAFDEAPELGGHARSNVRAWTWRFILFGLAAFWGLVGTGIYRAFL